MVNETISRNDFTHLAKEVTEKEGDDGTLHYMCIHADRFVEILKLIPKAKYLKVLVVGTGPDYLNICSKPDLVFM